MLDKKRLEQFPVFSGIDEKQLESIARHCEVMALTPGMVIVAQDEPAKYLYGVLSGEVELTLTFTYQTLSQDLQSDKGALARVKTMQKPVTVDTVVPGEIFGWSSLLDDGCQSATVSCTRGGEAFFVSSEILKEIFENDPRTGYQVMTRLYGVVSDRMRNRTHRLVELWGESFGMSDL
jgi:CRP-like cAMP-binding protein